MEAKPHYVSVVIYSGEGKSPDEKDADSGTIIFNSSNNVGTSNIVVESKRQQYSDSSIYIYRRDNVTSLFLLSNTAGVMIYCGAVWVNLDNWKSWVLFGVALAYVGLKVWQLLYPMIIRYWREDDTIS